MSSRKKFFPGRLEWGNLFAKFTGLPECCLLFIILGSSASRSFFSHFLIQNQPFSSFSPFLTFMPALKCRQKRAGANIRGRKKGRTKNKQETGSTRNFVPRVNRDAFYVFSASWSQQPHLPTARFMGLNAGGLQVRKRLREEGTYLIKTGRGRQQRVARFPREGTWEKRNNAGKKARGDKEK